MKQTLPFTLIVVVLLAAYIGSYLAVTTKMTFVPVIPSPTRIPTTGSVSAPTTDARIVEYQWMTVIYRPLAHLEKFVTGHETELVHMRSMDFQITRQPTPFSGILSS
ncbi:MAG: hypothetical protein HUJ26_13880 [Planctomycetaceae bacterium]|nr:hypothetical protein [Planctomycetaceae bacterium]